MAEYCFDTQRRELFTEAYVRGWRQSIIDFPRHDLPAAIAGIADELRESVCCIDSEFAYQALVVTAYGTGYTATLTLPQISERQRFVMAGNLKSMSRDEGVAVLRQVMSFSQHGQRLIDQAFSQFQEKFAEAVRTARH
jgi:hypothetical protein